MSEEASKEINVGPNLVEELPKYDAVIDVRSLDERFGELGSIPLSQHLLLTNIVQQSGSDAIPSHLDRNANILLVCRSGGRSGKAQSALASKGFTNLTNLQGGTQEYVRQGLPSVNVANGSGSQSTTLSVDEAKKQIIKLYADSMKSSEDSVTQSKESSMENDYEKAVGHMNEILSRNSSKTVLSKTVEEVNTPEELELLVSALAVSMKSEWSFERITEFTNKGMAIAYSAF